MDGYYKQSQRVVLCAQESGSGGLALGEGLRKGVMAENMV